MGLVVSPYHEWEAETNEPSHYVEDPDTHRVKMGKIGLRIAKEMNFHGPVDYYKTATPTFEVDNRHLPIAAEYHTSGSKRGTINVYPMNIGHHADIHKVLPHEISHAMWDALKIHADRHYINDPVYRKTIEEMSETDPNDKNKSKVNWGLAREFLKSYPEALYHIYTDHFNKDNSSISNYNKDVWKDRENGKITKENAVDEAIAEMAAKQRTTAFNILKHKASDITPEELRQHVLYHNVANDKIDLRVAEAPSRLADWYHNNYIKKSREKLLKALPNIKR